MAESFWRRELTGRKLVFWLMWWGVHWGLFAYGWYVHTHLAPPNPALANNPTGTAK